MHENAAFSTNTSARAQQNPAGQFEDPISLRKFRSDLIRKALYPALLRRWLPRAQKYLAEVQKYEFASGNTILEIQWSKLSSLIRHAAENVPYYRQLFDEHGIRPEAVDSPKDFARIPVLTKATLQSRLDDLVAINREKTTGKPNASGGSTGRPVQFFQDREYWERAYANQWFVESWWGIRPGDRTAMVWGTDRDIAEQGWRERLQNEILQVRVCNAFALTESQMEKFARMLVSWNPRYMTAYASAIEMFATFLLDRKEFRIRPHAIKTTADVLSEQRRQIIERAFECPVYNFYGSREVNNLAAECQRREGLHVNTLARYVEIVDDTGNPLPPGTPGRLLLTDLTNYFQPFLRYEIEDIGSWKANACSCGRPFPLLERVWGRASDFILTPEGKSIHSVFFTHLFYDMPQVALFQVNQIGLEDIRVLLVLRPDVKEYPAEILKQRLDQAFGPKVNYKVEVVAHIDRPPSGKHRFTVSSVRTRWGVASRSCDPVD
jgi:phenylacetate-CoA ligase